MNNKLLYVLIVLLLVLIIVIGAGGYIIYTNLQSNNQNTEFSTNNNEVSEESSFSGKTFKTDINNTVLNINNSKGHEKLLKLSFTIKSSEENIAELVQEYNAEIQDSIIEIISGISSEELLTAAGKDLLKEEIIQSLNNNFSKLISKDNIIKKIYFTSVVFK